MHRGVFRIMQHKEMEQREPKLADYFIICCSFKYIYKYILNDFCH